MHSDNMKVKASDLKTYVQRMVDLLEDPTTLLRDPAAMHAVAEIKLVIWNKLLISWCILI